MSESLVPGESSGPVIAQLVLLSVIFVIAFLGNSAILVSVAYFKALQTVPNILIVNLALIDLLNTLVNMPIFAAFYILQSSAFQGKLPSYVVISMHNFLLYNNVLSLALLTADRYFAISHGIRYHVWKTARKAYGGMGVSWLLATVMIVCLGIYRHSVLEHYEGLKTIEYRRILYKSAGWRVAFAVYSVPFCVIFVLGGLTYRTVRKRALKIKELTQLGMYSTHMKEALEKGRQLEARTGQTIFLVVVVYLVCCFPALLHSVLVRRGVDSTWSEFFAYFFTHVTSACNPVVYALRAGRFRKVLMDLVRRRDRRHVYVPRTKQTFSETTNNPTASKSRVGGTERVTPTPQPRVAPCPGFKNTPNRIPVTSSRKEDMRFSHVVVNVEPMRRSATLTRPRLVRRERTLSQPVAHCSNVHNNLGLRADDLEQRKYWTDPFTAKGEFD